jgi:hypothetical protein
MLSLALLLLCPISWGKGQKLGNLRQHQPGMQIAPESVSFFLNMGTSKGAHDVMHNDVIADAFSLGSEDFGTQDMYNVPASHHHLSIYMYSSSSDLVMQQPTISVQSGDVEVDYINSKNLFTLVPKLANPKSTDTYASASFQFECLAAGTSVIQVDFRLLHKQSKMQKEFTMSFSKSCLQEDTNVQGSFIEGVMVGTSPQTNNVVKDGEPQPAWDIHTVDGVDVVDTQLWASEVSKVFYLRSLELDLTILSPFIIVENENLVGVTATGLETLLLTKDPSEFTLQFSCYQAGSTEVTVALHLPDFPTSKILWSFSKQCDGLNIHEGQSIPGLNVGTSQGGSDVIRGGLTTTLFRNAISNDEEASKELYLVSEPAITFYIESQEQNVMMRKPIIVMERTLNEDLLHVVKPALSGSAVRAITLRPGNALELTITFNCQRNDLTDLTVQIPLKSPEGYLQFAFEVSCTVADDFIPQADAKLTKLPGLNIGLANGLANVVQDGLPRTKFHWETSIRDLKIIDTDTKYLTFYLTKNESQSAADDIRLGVPELASTIQIADPLISGRASAGDLVTKDSHSTVSLTFHCITEGVAVFSLVIPVLPLEEGDVAPRDEPITITFLKQCPAFHMGVDVGLGGVGIDGFFVGTTKGGSDVVRNGFPTPAYYGQRHKDNPDWDEIMVPTSEKATRLYISLVGGFNVGGKDFKPRTVEFQAPMAVTHGHEAAPKLSGAGVGGGKLSSKSTSPIELDITWNCRFRGTGTVTIAIPVVPHGRITFTIPKQCDGIDRPEGEYLPGFEIGTTSGGNDVVKEGLTQPNFRPYKRNEPPRYLVDDEDFTLYVMHKDKAVGALEPVVFAARKIANPYIVHDLKVGTDDETEWEENVAVVIPTEPAGLTVKYNCISYGETPITLVIPLLPRGNQVSVTWTVLCGGEDWSYAGYMEDDFSFTYWDDYMYPWSSYYDQYLDSDWFLSDYYTYDEYYSWGYYGSSDFFYTDWETTDEFSWNPYVDTGLLYSDHAPLGWLNVGTFQEPPFNADVVIYGHALEAYALPLVEKEGDEDGIEDITYTVISRAVDSLTFYLSVPFGYQPFFTPSVTAKVGAKGADICTPQLSGTAAFGGNLTAGLLGMSALTVDFNCQRPGVTPVVVTIPLIPSWRGQVSFRVIKVCRDYEPTVEWYWTASRIMISGALFVAAIAALVGYRYLSNDTGYSRVAANKPSTKIQMDDFDVVDSDSD